MKEKRDNRGWVIILILLTLVLNTQAQNLINLEFKNKPLPAALKLIEREGGKNIIFSVTETEKHSVSANIQQKTQAEAIGIILQGTPFIYKERTDYFAIQKKDARTKAIEIQEKVLNHFMGNDSSRVATAHASLARYYLLQDKLDEANKHMRLAEEHADEEFRNNWAMTGYMELMKSILNYAQHKRINMMEWANFVNSLQESASHKQAITDAKEENNRLLIERNLKLTIEQQRTQITFTYVAIGLVIIIGGLAFYTRKKKRQMVEKEEELEALRKLVTESQQPTEQKDDRFFKRILLQQLGVIRMAASNPTTANQELIRRMSEIVDGQVPVDSLLNWEDLYQTIDYIYDGF